MCSIPLKQFPSAAKESQVRSKSKVFKFHSLIAEQYCAYPGRGGEGILDQHTSAPWLLKHTLWYNGTSSWPLTFLPDKNPASLSLFVIPEQMKCSKSQTEPCLSAVIHICSLHYLPSRRHLPSHGQRWNMFLLQHVQWSSCTSAAQLTSPLPSASNLLLLLTCAHLSFHFLQSAEHYLHTVQDCKHNAKVKKKKVYHKMQYFQPLPKNKWKCAYFNSCDSP